MNKRTMLSTLVLSAVATTSFAADNNFIGGTDLEHQANTVNVLSTRIDTIDTIDTKVNRLGASSADYVAEAKDKDARIARLEKLVNELVAKEAK